MARRSPSTGVYQTTALLAVVLVLVIVFVAAGYFLVLPKSHSAMLEELQHNRGLWNRRAPDTFSYVIDPECVCVPKDTEPYSVLDENGYLTAKFESLSHMTSGSDDSVPRNVLSIHGAFKLVEKGIDEAGHLQVQYDDSYGFPADVMIYWSQQGADDYEGFRIYDFEAIEN